MQILEIILYGCVWLVSFHFAVRSCNETLNRIFVQPYLLETKKYHL